jgi:tetratricopeptide (TPR) repeat protein
MNNVIKHLLKRIFQSTLLISVVILLPVSINAQAQNIKDSDEIKALVLKGNVLMSTRQLINYEKATLQFRKALLKEPENYDLMIRVADALNHIMRAKTNGNIILLSGKTQDNERNKTIWSKYAIEALKLSAKAVKANPDDRKALLTYAESYLYLSSSFGILKAIFKGAAEQYKRNANALITKYPKADDALGDIYMGAFYAVSPWPMSSRKKARKHFENALKLAPESIRSHYYVGLQAFIDNEYKTAKMEFDFVIDNPCTQNSEYDYCSFMKKEAEKGLVKIDKISR